MVSEVKDQYVDISAAAYAWKWNAELNSLVDFTVEIGSTSIALFIRKPSKHDLSFRYFFLGKEILAQVFCSTTRLIEDFLLDVK